MAAAGPWQPAAAPTLKPAEALAESGELKTQAEAHAGTAKALGTQADKEGKLALALLTAEVKRTDRDDVRAILHWAETRLQA